MSGASFHALRMIFRAHHGRDPVDGPAYCRFCGGPCPEDSMPAGKVFRSTFNDLDRARRGPDSPVCCEACTWYFEFKAVPGHGATGKLFTYHLAVWPDRWERWDRGQMAADLLGWHCDGVPADCALAICFSHKKHVLPWARVNPAGTRRPWIATDRGAASARLSDDFPQLLGSVAELLGRGYRRTAIGEGRPDSYTLSRSPDPAGDLELFGVVGRHAGSLLLEIATYVITEDNRDGIAREFAPVLRHTGPVPATGGAAAGDPERRGRPVVQVPVRATLVEDPRGARSPGGADHGEPDRVQQLALL